MFRKYTRRNDTRSKVGAKSLENLKEGKVNRVNILIESSHSKDCR